MVFSSLRFLFLFLPVFLGIYVLLPLKLRNLWLLIGSLFFYAYGTWKNPIGLVLFLLAIPVNFFCGKRISAAKRKRLWLILGLCYDFGILFVFKYAGFLTGVIDAVIPSVSLPQIALTLPIGISFYTFQIASYLIDVYRETVPAETSLVRLGTYLSMFPQLIAGPIVSYRSVSDTLRCPMTDFQKFDRGLKEFTLGLGAKVVLANRMGGLWAAAAKIGYESISAPFAWLSLTAYTLQIYFDFFGYSMMAVGLGRMLGFSLPKNFRRPYTAKTMTEFWRRWHITLGTWFRDYIYIPLGGNRVSTAKTIRNLLVVWLLTGIWHGAGWNFLLWGLLLFLLIASEKFFYGKFLQQHALLGHCYMALVIPLSWAVFEIRDLKQMGIFFSRLFSVWRPEEWSGASDLLRYLPDYLPWLLLGFLCLTKLPQKLLHCRFRPVSYGVLAVSFWLSVLFLVQGLDDPFLYFQF